VETSQLLLRPLTDLLYQPLMINGDECGIISGMSDWQGKLKQSEKTCVKCCFVHHKSHMTWRRLPQ
jgi:hypothetical protein